MPTLEERVGAIEITLQKAKADLLALSNLIWDVRVKIVALRTDINKDKLQVKTLLEQRLRDIQLIKRRVK